jgi:hypothetical protein
MEKGQAAAKAYTLRIDEQSVHVKDAGQDIHLKVRCGVVVVGLIATGPESLMLADAPQESGSEGFVFRSRQPAKMDALSASLLSAGFLKAPLDAANPQTALQELSKAFQAYSAHNQLAVSRHAALQYDLDRALKESEKAKTAAAHLEKDREHANANSKQATLDLATERQRHSQTRTDFQQTKLALQYVKSGEFLKLPQPK